MRDGASLAAAGEKVVWPLTGPGQCVEHPKGGRSTLDPVRILTHLLTHSCLRPLSKY